MSLLTEEQNPVIQLENISASYGAVSALRNISLSVFRGEIHAIVGEHGAGKSTLAKIVSNLISPAEGSVFYEGRPLSGKSYKNTINAGIRMVYQKMRLNESLTVAENLFIANLKDFRSAFGMYNRRKVFTLAYKFLKENSFDLDPAMLVSHLELPKRALLSIVRNFYNPPSVLILDESLEKLSSTGLESVIRNLKDLRDKGMAILFITHRIDDLYTLADRVSVIRKGEILITENIRELDKINLIKMAYTQFTSLEEQNEKIQEFEKLLKYNEAVLTRLPINLIVSSADNVVKLINENAVNFFNVKKGGHNILGDLLDKNPSLESLIDKALTDRTIKHLYNRPLVYGRDIFTVNIIVYPIVEFDEILGYMLILEDNTESEKMREQLLLSEKLASIGLLAAGVAHEINNPLAVISNYLESFREDCFSPGEKNQIINHLFDQVEYITQVVDNLVSFSENRESAGEVIEIGTEIGNIIDIIKFNGRAQNIRIFYNAPDRDFFVSLKKGEFSQILLNLFKNSFDVLPDGGDITITVELGGEAKEGLLQVYFSDNGPGISLAEPNDIFLPFNTTKHSGANYGLGLSLCYNILKRNKGEISLVSTESAGSLFRISLPLLDM